MMEGHSAMLVCMMQVGITPLSSRQRYLYDLMIVCKNSEHSRHNDVDFLLQSRGRQRASLRQRAKLASAA